MKIMGSLLFSFLSLCLAFLFNPQISYADINFTVNNLNFDPISGNFTFDYSGTGGATLNHQITFRLPLDASIFNYDVNEGFFTCTPSHCSGTYTGNKSNFTCSGSDYRVMSTTNGSQYTSNSLTSTEFSTSCSNSPSPSPTPPSGQNIFQDNFNNTNGILLTNHNNLWHFIDGAQPKIQNNSLLAQDGYARFSLPVTLTDECASFDFQYPLTGRKEMWLRAKDIPTNFQQRGYYFLLDEPTPNQPFFGISDDLGWLTNSTFPTLLPGWHNFKACIIGTELTAYIDKIKIANAFARNSYIDGYPRIGISQGNYIDNFSLEKISSSFLPVPLFKQTSDPWQGLEYDSANLWNPSNPTINRWGCALTSAAMVFTYQGINKLPDGTALDPGTLNSWLENQKDGYIRHGWVNWLALSRLSKEATSINNITAFDALEYKRVNGEDKQQLTDDINNNIPDILEEPGHFIVGKGIDGDTFAINDPYYSRETLNDGYNNTFLSLRRFVPSHTDLSYIMLVADADVTMQLLDGNNNIIAESSIQQPITDPENPSDQNESISILYAQKPVSGNYKITISGNENKQAKISIYTYDLNGNVSISNNQIIGNDSFSINFDKNDSNNSRIEKIVTFASTIKDIKELQNLHQIKIALEISTYALIKNAEHLHDKGKDKQAEHLINAAINLVEKTPSWFIDAQAKEILIYDFNQLKSSL